MTHYLTLTLRSCQDVRGDGRPPASSRPQHETAAGPQLGVCKCPDPSLLHFCKCSALSCPYQAHLQPAHTEPHALFSASPGRGAFLELHSPPPSQNPAYKAPPLDISPSGLAVGDFRVLIQNLPWFCFLPWLLPHFPFPQ